MSQTSLMAELTRQTDETVNPAMAAISFWGFVHHGAIHGLTLQPGEEERKPITVGGEVLHAQVRRINAETYVVTVAESEQVVRPGEVSTIDHRFLRTEAFRKACEDELEQFCRKIGIQYRTPRWRFSCGRVNG